MKTEFNHLFKTAMAVCFPSIKWWFQHDKIKYTSVQLKWLDFYHLNIFGKKQRRMNTHLEKARLLVIILMFAICVYFIEDLSNIEISFKVKERYVL